MLEAARRGDKKARADVEREIDIAGPDVADDVRRILGGDDDRALRADLRRASGKRAGRVELSARAVAVDIERLGDVGFIATLVRRRVVAGDGVYVRVNVSGRRT